MNQKMDDRKRKQELNFRRFESASQFGSPFRWRATGMGLLAGGFLLMNSARAWTITNVNIGVDSNSLAWSKVNNNNNTIVAVLNAQAVSNAWFLSQLTNLNNGNTNFIVTVNGGNNVLVTTRTNSNGTLAVTLGVPQLTATNGTGFIVTNTAPTGTGMGTYFGFSTNTATGFITPAITITNEDGSLNGNASFALVPNGSNYKWILTANENPPHNFQFYDYVAGSLPFSIDQGIYPNVFALHQTGATEGGTFTATNGFVLPTNATCQMVISNGLSGLWNSNGVATWLRTSQKGSTSFTDHLLFLH